MDARTANREMELDPGTMDVSLSYKGFEGVKPCRHKGVFVASNGPSKGNEIALCTKNIVPGEAVYDDENIISVQNEDGTKVEYRVWNHLCSTLAAAILCGARDIYIKPGAHVLYLGAGLGTTLSHVSDIVGPNGLVYAVESSLTSGRDLMNMAEKRTNIIPIIQDAKFPAKYRMLVGMVDVICSDIADPDQVSILEQNALWFLKDSGNYVMSIKPSCANSSKQANAQSAEEMRKLEISRLLPKGFAHLWDLLEVHHFCTFGFYNRSTSSVGGKKRMFGLLTPVPPKQNSVRG